MEKDRYKLKDTAKKLGIKVRTLREWVKNGKVKAFKYDFSPMWFVSAEEIERLLNEMKEV